MNSAPQPLGGPPPGAPLPPAPGGPMPEQAMRSTPPPAGTPPGSRSQSGAAGGAAPETTVQPAPPAAALPPGSRPRSSASTGSVPEESLDSAQLSVGKASGSPPPPGAPLQPMDARAPPPTGASMAAMQYAAPPAQPGSTNMESSFNVSAPRSADIRRAAGAEHEAAIVCFGVDLDDALISTQHIIHPGTRSDVCETCCRRQHQHACGILQQACHVCAHKRAIAVKRAEVSPDPPVSTVIWPPPAPDRVAPRRGRRTPIADFHVAQKRSRKCRDEIFV
eukprot:360207-Chlamydomonas_euryale.AAC.1